ILEDMYDVIADRYGYTESFKKVKNDLINWQGQNQEHHAFDESSYNFVHAKTSGEVEEIFESIFELSLRIFKKNRDKYKKHIKQCMIRQNTLISKLNNPSFVDKVPQEVIED